MTLTEAVQVAEKYQAWRLDDSDDLLIGCAEDEVRREIALANLP